MNVSFNITSGSTLRERLKARREKVKEGTLAGDTEAAGPSTRKPIADTWVIMQHFNIFVYSSLDYVKSNFLHLLCSKLIFLRNI